MRLPIIRALTLVLTCSLLWGCASGGHHQRFQLEALDAPFIAELQDVPFFPQDEFQCGPAALATVLNAAGASVTPAALTPQIYLDGRKGSLQLELVAAARRHGLLPYPQNASFAALLEQLQAEQPVLMLQNLGFAWAPTWHYAVVVGYNPQQGQVLLRSGRTRLQKMPLKEFERTWRYSDYWALTVHSPGTVPAGARVANYVQAAAGMEATGQLDAAALAYQAAVQHWPESMIAWMGLGNSRYQQHRYQEAEAAYRQAAVLAEDNPAPWHNLAWALIKQQQNQQALPFASKAAQLAGPEAPAYRSALQALQ